MSYLNDFFYLFYPRLCALCNLSLYKHEELLCTACRSELPKTLTHTIENNELCKIFWGRIPLDHVSAMFYFQKGNRVQELIHQLKYKGRKEIGQYLGKIYGEQLFNAEFYKHVEVIIPVPLHPKKRRKRGYNQSEIIANGMSESMKIPMDLKTLIKISVSETQTRKSRFKRWENVKEVFEVKKFDHLINKHILLVDDVLTTGATIESCALQLLKIPGVKISVATIACSVL
jgi:ComF family protein